MTHRLLNLHVRRQAMLRAIRRQAFQLARARGENLSSELRAQISGEKRPDALCDVVAANFLSNVEDKQAVLECMSIDLRLETLLTALARDLKVTALEEKIHARVREAMDKSNHDYYLREQIHAIQEELGEDEDEELRALRARLRDSKMEGEARERTEKEIARLQKDKKNVEGEIARAQGKLNNQGFVSKAPAHLIEQEKQKLETNKGLLVKLDARIAEMEALR